MTTFLTPEELRREAAFRRLKSRYPICLICGYWAHPAAIEFAHLIPKAFKLGWGNPLCRNCHRELTDMEKDMSFKPTTTEVELETIGRLLGAIGEQYEKSAPTLKHLSAIALETARRLGTPSKDNNSDDDGSGA